MKVVHKFKTYKRTPYIVVLQKKVVKPDGTVCFGICDSPNKDGAFIRLENGQGDYRMIETIIHEMAHAFFFESCETNVSQFASSVMTLLKKMGLLVRVNGHSRYRSKASASRTGKLKSGRA